MAKKFLLFISLIVFANGFAQSGKVGVNTTTPTETLDVNGTLRVRNIPSLGAPSNAAIKDSIMIFDNDGIVKYTSANAILSQADAGNAKVLTNSSLIGDGTTGNGLGIAQQGATTGQVLTWNGSAWVPLAAAPATTTNSLSSNANTMMSSVNGVSSSASVVNSIANTISAGQLTTSVNGISTTPVTLPVADGSETKINVGTNMSITGSGTSANPYIINNTFSEVDGSATNELNSSLSSTGNTLTITDAGGNLTASMVNSNVLSLSGSTLTSSINGVSASQDLSSLQTVTNITNTQATGKTIATYTNESNVSKDIKETITNLTQNTTTGVITYTKEDGTTATANVVSTNADNIISVGTDGGSYRALKVIDVYDTGAVQNIINAVSTLNLGSTRTLVGGIYNRAGNQITVSEAGIYRINYSVGTTVPPNTNEFSSRFWLENGGTEIPSSNIIIHAYDGSDNCSSKSMIIELPAGSVIRIRMQRVNNTNMQTIPSCTGLNIEKLN